jgi:predicted RNA binding protein YcfA (HicA-like mRNA interferase family)
MSPKLPRDVLPQDLIRFLKKRGWVIDREGGRHTIMSRGPADTEISIPRHGPLKTGTLSAILKQAGVSEAEWSEL